MNNIKLMGRLTKDVDLRLSTSGNENHAVAKFTLAVDRNMSKEQREKAENSKKPTADFVPCVVFGKRGMKIGDYIGKGNRVIVDGRLQLDKFTDKDGNTVYTTQVVADNIVIIDFKNNNNNNEKTQAAPVNNDYGDSFVDFGDESMMPAPWEL